MHDVKVKFQTPEFSSREIITYLFHVGKYKDDTEIVYYMIMDQYIMAQIRLIYYFKRNVLEWGGGKTTTK